MKFCFVVLLLVSLDSGYVLVALVAVGCEELLEAYLEWVCRRGELLLVATTLKECFALGLHLCAMLLVEGNLDGLHHRTKSLDRFLL